MKNFDSEKMINEWADYLKVKRELAVQQALGLFDENAKVYFCRKCGVYTIHVLRKGEYFTKNYYRCCKCDDVM